MRTRKVFLFMMFIIFFSHDAFAQGRNIDSLKSDIYSKLKCCPCLVSFDKCTCSEAKEMKAYIDALLESGMSREEIFYKVAKKFSLNVIIDKRVKSEIEKRLLDEAGEKHPQIILDPISFDFGQVSKKQGRVSKNFKLSNQGNTDLIIKSIKTLCPCATVSLKTGKNKSPYFGTKGSPGGWQMEIKPGQSGELELVIDLDSPHIKPGKLVREAVITSNDPVYPEITVSIQAEVVD